MTTAITTITTLSPSLFSTAPYIPPPPDAVFALTAEYNADPSPTKVNLGQGTYRDINGPPWILLSMLLHEYLPILGLEGLRAEVARLVFGEGYAAVAEKLATPQSISRTGPLHLARALIKYCTLKAKDRGVDAVRKVYIPSPTWSNHHLLFSSLGFKVIHFDYYNSATKSLDIDSYLSTLRSADPGSVVLLHACAHNPTGLDPDTKQWKEIGSMIKERRLFPVFDAAYLGFNSGDYDKDAWAILCLSFAKNMGLYGERVGALIIFTAVPVVAKNTQSVLESLQRSEISNPPAFEAKIAEAILSDKRLRSIWFEDLKTMSGRISEMRRALFEGLNRYCTQSGMFGLLGYSRVSCVVHEYHIYMADNSRVSIAGLNTGNVEYVARSIAEVLARGQ
ncbi:pyridoxal phosphate-dependent transferase [Aspergillus falconensis]